MFCSRTKDRILRSFGRYNLPVHEYYYRNDDPPDIVDFIHWSYFSSSNLYLTPIPFHLLPPVSLHHQNLHHPHKDIQEVQLQTDTLIDCILSNQTPLSHSSMSQDLLHIIECEATEDGQTTPQPDVLSESQSTSSSGGKDQGSETRYGDESASSKKWSTEVEVFFLLSSGANEGNRSHHGEGVETGTADDSGRCHEEEWSDECGLSDVEGGPESIFLNIASKTISAYRSLSHIHNLRKRGKKLTC
jgi:hypothetical protein